jgi:hypothetical protein
MLVWGDVVRGFLLATTVPFIMGCGAVRRIVMSPPLETAADFLLRRFGVDRRDPRRGAMGSAENVIEDKLGAVGNSGAEGGALSE